MSTIIYQISNLTKGHHNSFEIRGAEAFEEKRSELKDMDILVVERDLCDFEDDWNNKVLNAWAQLGPKFFRAQRMQDGSIFSYCKDDNYGHSEYPKKWLKDEDLAILEKLENFYNKGA